MSIERIDCTALGCDAELFPVSFDACATEYAYNEIGMIAIANVGQPFANIEDPAEWAARTSDAGTNPNAIRLIPVIGTLETEQGEQINVPGNKTIFGKKSFTFSGNIYDNNNINYQWLRSTGCNKQFLFWFLTSDGLHTYGGNAGITTVLNGYENITDDREGLRVMTVEAIWQSTLIPDRDNSVI